VGLKRARDVRPIPVSLNHPPGRHQASDHRKRRNIVEEGQGGLDDGKKEGSLSLISSQMKGMKG
jgi:hypothetical protein